MTKLLDVDPQERYTADQCLKHPWITRNPNDEAPLTIAERMRIFNAEQTFSRVIYIFYCFIIKKK